MTLEPDDAELAAMALLEMLSGTVADVPKEEPMAVTREYYSALADKIRHTRETERMVAARAVAYCEERLQRGSTSSLEEVLYKHRVTIEREGGELKRRWQHCLAAVTVRSMEGINL